MALAKTASRSSALQRTSKLRRKFVVFSLLPFMLAHSWHKKLKSLSLFGWWYFCLGAGFPAAKNRELLGHFTMLTHE